MGASNRHVPWCVPCNAIVANVHGAGPWRNHKYVNAEENMKIQHMLPGLTNAVGIFGVYLILDSALAAVRQSAKHGEEGAKAIAELKKLKKELGVEDEH